MIDEGELVFTGTMDRECVALSKAMSALPGIQTFESCCGHGERPYRIWFACNRLTRLPPLLYWFKGCHCGFYGWHVEVYTDCAMSPARFMVEGPVQGAEDAYVQAIKIAELLLDNI